MNPKEELGARLEEKEKKNMPLLRSVAAAGLLHSVRYLLGDVTRVFLFLPTPN